MLFLVFNSAIRNPKSAFEYANFFRDDTKYQFLKPRSLFNFKAKG